MKCPIDDTNLSMSERHGIEIDYCPTCRGVWLDRGELDKIIERAASENNRPTNDDRNEQPGRSGSYDRDDRGDRNDRGRDDDDDDDRRRGGVGQKAKKSKRGGFLGELFEFGG